MVEIIIDQIDTKKQLEKYKRIGFSNVERKGFGEGIYINSRSIPLFKGDLSLAG